MSPNYRLTNAAGSSGGVQLAHNGTGLGVAWNDNQTGNEEIFFEVVDANGTPATALNVSNTPAQSTSPSIAWTGSDYGVMWVEGASPYTMMFQEIDADGALLGSPTMMSIGPSGYTEGRSQRWTGSAHAAAWQADPGGGDDIFFALFDSAGNETSATVQVTPQPGPSAFPSVAPNGAGFGIVWNDNRSGNPQIYFAALDADGAKPGGDVRVTNTTGTAFAPSLDWTGTHYGASWWDNSSGTSEQYFALLDTSGALLAPAIELTPGQYSQAGLVRWSGTQWGAVWFDFRNGILEPYFARLDANGNKLGDDVRVSTAGIDVELDALDLQWIGDRWAIAWSDKRVANNAEIYLALATCP